MKAIPFRFVCIAGPVLLVVCATGCVGVGDLVTTRQEQPVTIPVLANDGFEKGAQVLAVTQPSHGAATIEPDGTVRYTPAPGFAGVDTFAYHASDGRSAADPSVTVVVQPPLALIGCAFGPYVDGQNPDFGGTVDFQRLSELLRLARPYCDAIRFYGLSDDLLFAPVLARGLGFHTVLVGAWIGPDDAVNQQQISRLIMLSPAADVLIVGSEALLRGDVTPAQMIAYIDQVHVAVPGKPVATSEVYHVLLANPDVMAASDVILAHIHAYWDGIPVSAAVPWIYQQYLRLVQANPGKEVVVSETGWRSFGPTNGAAVPSSANQTAFLLNLTSFTRATGVPVFYFSAFDEPWKSADDGWGFFTSGLVLKPDMADRVFAGEALPDNWSREEPACGFGQPSVRFTFVSPLGDRQGIVSGQVLHVSPAHYNIATYINVNGVWWVKPLADAPLSFIAADGSFTADITTGGVDQDATQINVYVVPETYAPPIALGWPSLPAELDQAAVASVSVTRPNPNLVVPTVCP